MNARHDATVEFERQARAFVEDVRDLPPDARRDALQGEVARLSEHRYALVAGPALDVLREALA